MPAQPAPAEFTSDSEYLQQEGLFLRARSTRIDAEKSAQYSRDSEDGEPSLLRRPGRIGAREERCRVMELKCEEKRLREETDARIELHRADPSRFKLGLDVLAEKHGLSGEERLLLLTASLPAIGQAVAEDVLGRVATSLYGAATVSDLIKVLDPAGIADWLKLRKLFRPTAALRRGGLIRLSTHDTDDGPETIMNSSVRLTRATFATLIGDPDAATELDASAVQP